MPRILSCVVGIFTILATGIVSRSTSQEPRERSTKAVVKDSISETVGSQVAEPRSAALQVLPIAHLDAPRVTIRKKIGRNIWPNFFLSDYQ